MIILSVLFSLLALAAWSQVLFGILGQSHDPSLLIALQTVIGLAAAATAWGSWKRATWTASAALIYGIVVAGMLVALPTILHLPADARSGIWTGAAAVMVFALLCAIYFRSNARRRSRANVEPAS